ncbi:MAG: hypothetical protein U9Q06_04885 [Nanoarchaeota archaeon]|nr:hypothetical protein [Nanoarchaeota archaeon]
MGKNQILHYPRLDTIMMVEETIKKLDFYPTKSELWKKLPKKVMHQTFNLIIDYLNEIGKIYIDKEGVIIWTWNPTLLKKIRKQGLIIK